MTSGYIAITFTTSFFPQGGRAGRRGDERARRNLPVSGGAVDHSANLELRG